MLTHQGTHTRHFVVSCVLISITVFAAQHTTYAAPSTATVRSPNGRNSISLAAAETKAAGLQLVIERDNRVLFTASSIGPILKKIGQLATDSRIVDVKKANVDERFELPWGKTKEVQNQCSTVVAKLSTTSKFTWQIELRAYDDGVAFRYLVSQQGEMNQIDIADEATELMVTGQPAALFDTLTSFTTSHEALYDRKPLGQVPAKKLMDMPVLFVWASGPAAAITEARIWDFAGGYLERPSEKRESVRWRLSPHPRHNDIAVMGKSCESPWRVVLLADTAGKLLESNLLLCLNDPPRDNFSWARPGKTTFHWWYGEFEDDYKLPNESHTYVERHKKYIDFCAQNKIAYHSVSGDGLAWYPQSKTDYGTPKPDADVREPRPEIKLPEIIDYARKRNVGIRLWVHWKPLSEQLEEAFTRYESWGIKGLMVDFLDRDDQQIVEFTHRMLESAARHKLHIQIHGSSKYSGEQRTYPNLFNREGVLNLEYDKWSRLCTPQHAVNVAYTRALAGPVDFHLGGFRSVSRAEFRPRDRAPLVMGTRCHHLALYVVYENPMPMVADAPTSYEGQSGFDFIRDVPTTWDETRFVAGEPGEYIVVARRSGNTWYIAGITNWTKRNIDVPFRFLHSGSYVVKLYVDGSMDESKTNVIKAENRKASPSKSLLVRMAPGGGFVGHVVTK
jgi:alpha-glucosidase